MPIKFGFQRRKTSGSDLTVAAAALELPQPSFRVLERPLSATQSFEDGFTSRKRATTDARPLNDGQFLDYRQGGYGHRDIVNRGSTGTQLSAASGHYQKSDSSPLRYSNSPTVPSTASSTNYDGTQLKQPQTISSQDTSTSPPSFLKSAGKVLPLGSKGPEKASSSSVEALGVHQHNLGFDDVPELSNRKRASTDSIDAGNGLTRPRMTAYNNNWQGITSKDSACRLSIKYDNDDSGKMFGNAHISTGRSSLEAIKHIQTLTTRPITPSSSLQLDRQYHDSPGILKGTIRASNDHSISLSPPYIDDGMDEEEEEENVYEYRSAFRRSRNLTISPSRDLSESPSRPLMHSWGSHGLEHHRLSDPILDSDTRSMLGFFNSQRITEGYTSISTISSTPLSTQSPPVEANDPPQRSVTLYDGDYPDDDSIRQSHQGSLRNTRSTHEQASEIEPDLDTDLEFQEMARSAARIEAGEQPIKEHLKLPGKVMSAARFEKYREEQELYRHNSNATKASGENYDDEYDEDDELERNREMVKERRKQEAKMSVYRQQMMKVTGETNTQQAPAMSSRPEIYATNWSTNWSSDNGDGEDEDVPLGILAAHGFPSKNRPPSHRPQTVSPSTIRYSSDSCPPTVPSLHSTGQNLPAFARNLPHDPYYGASIVNPVIRESIGYTSSSRPGSIYGGSDVAVSRVHPGGLVGVISKEEQAKALRRSSPNRTFETSNQNAGIPIAPSMLPNFSHIPSTSMLSPDSQAQMAINQQMQQTMQMQLQWMQQMMVMQGTYMSGSSTIPGMGIPSTGQQSILPLPGSVTSPNSVHNARKYRSGSPKNGYSTMLPSPERAASPYQNSYVASIAPSVRSSVGQPSRYRPVSVAPVSSRTSMLLPSNPLSGINQESTRPHLRSNLSVSSLTGFQSGSATRLISKDTKAEDSDEAWEEMYRKKESKKKLWRSKKTKTAEDKENSLQDVFYPTEIP